ncbi:MAG TPA: hypothetical protein VK509_22440 [Polyangiales bacterium]|nr:hypothetical protein [Polyangiales bacterium]
MLAIHRLALCLLLPAALALAQAAPPVATGKDAGLPRAGVQPKLPRPAVDQRVQALGETLLRAIASDEPALAEDTFFPRPAFLRVKAMQNPGRYWDRLHARFARDIHALHAGTPNIAQARFERLELATRGGLVQPGEEGNRLAYWASRHSRLHYRIGEQARSFELRVIISWEDGWYLIHLSEFRSR